MITAPPLTRAPGHAAALVYERALLRAAAGRAATLTLVDDSGRERRVDAAGWCRPHLPGDAGLLARCAGTTLDVGCGPGRLTAALHRAGVPALGIDLSRVAVRLARRRGATALRRDVFGPVPGRWRHVLLADGNIGIGGDPASLLRRCRALLTDGGRIHAELTAPGSRTWAGPATLRAAGGDAAWRPAGGEAALRPAGGEAAFRWAEVAADQVADVAGPAGLRVAETWTEAGRWFTTLTAA
jgi:SAM-dependent methyltransferase